MEKWILIVGIVLLLLPTIADWIEDLWYWVGGIERD